MYVEHVIRVPTGEIYIVKGSRGPLEFVSLGDYGQHVNLNQHSPVPDGMPLLPLTEKWVVTISTQYGCSMGCKFCDVPKVGPGVNVSLPNLNGQISTALAMPGKPSFSRRLNVHFARMGEPTFNFAVLDCAKWLSTLRQFNPHPVVSTMMPKFNTFLPCFIREWMDIKNEIYEGNAGLQLSINSTDEAERAEMFNNQALSIRQIARMMSWIKPRGRKITLNFMVADYTVDCNMLADLFTPDRYIVKLTPAHNTQAAMAAGIQTKGDPTWPEPYLDLEERFQRAGFETLVFIASREEDEGMITCGNAILSKKPDWSYRVQ